MERWAASTVLAIAAAGWRRLPSPLPRPSRVAGGVSVMPGMRGHSLGVLAAGFGVLADVTGSATVI